MNRPSRICTLRSALWALVAAAWLLPWTAHAEGNEPSEQRYSGGTVPPGFRLERRTETGLTLAGGVTFGIGYGFMFVANSKETPAGFIPVVGPFIAAASVRGNHEVPNEVTQGVLITLGVVQIAGLALVAAGLVGRRVLVRDAGIGPSFRISPSFGRGSTGLMLGASF